MKNNIEDIKNTSVYKEQLSKIQTERASINSKLDDEIKRLKSIKNNKNAKKTA